MGEYERNRGVATPEGITNTNAYDFRNNIVSSTDGRGNATTFAYDNNSNLTKATYADESYVSYHYDSLNRAIRFEDQNLNSTAYTYDNIGNVTSVEKPNDIVTSYTYDKNGNKLTEALNGITLNTFEYDYRNNPIKVSDNLGNTVGYEYDIVGDLTSYTTAKNKTYKYIYDGNGNVVQTTNPLNGNVSTEFDARGNQTSLTDENGNKTTYSYDSLNRFVSETSADGYSDRYTYDSLGLLTKYDNKRLLGISYTYNKDGIRTGRKSQTGSVAYSYDDNYNLLEVTGKSGNIQREYDKLDRVVKYKDANGNIIKYEYDNVGNLTRIWYPDNKSVGYSYNANNQLVKVTDWEGRTTSYEYNKDGRLEKMTRADGSAETYEYDSMGKLTRAVDYAVSLEIIHQYTYKYDEDGNIVEEISSNEPKDLSIEDAQMSYELANKINTYNGMTISYDADGNALNTPMGDGMLKLAYNEFNYLTQVSSDNTNAVYTYDDEGYRIAKTEKGVLTSYVVDTNSALSQVLTSTTGDETTYYIYGIGLIGHENNKGYRAYHFDSRGSTVALTDLDGRVTDTMFYEPYGNVVSRTGETYTPFMYVGEFGVETDDSGLYYMRARYYNPVIKRFVNEDPISYGYNWYRYAGGNPISRIDPTGHIDSDTLWAAGVGVYIGLKEKKNQYFPSLYGDIENMVIQKVENRLGIKSSKVNMELNKDTFVSLDGKMKKPSEIGQGVSAWALDYHFGDMSYLYENYNQMKPGVEVSDGDAYLYGKHFVGATEELGILGAMVYGGVQVAKGVGSGISSKVSAKFAGKAPPNYLNEALKQQGMKNAPNGLKQSWVEGGYKYEVRVHAGESQYTNAQSIYRVQRQSLPNPNPKIQGTGKEYMDIFGNWHHESTLREFNSGGIPNPNFNFDAAKNTHIILP